MNAPARTFTAVPAVRERVPLLIGLMGPSGSGKTFSALRLATGIQSATGGEIFVIDTEARRALHYADQFKFQHIDFRAPFGSLDYLAAIEHCVKAGAGVVVIDSLSHEHEGPGGMLDFHDKELDRMAGDDWQKRERVKMLAWQKPKAARQRMLNTILQMTTNFVFCFRAKEKVKPVKSGGKSEVKAMGFMPIAGEELVFEMTANCLLLPKSDGVPTWRSDEIGERQMMKLPEQFRKIFAAQKPLDEDTGRALAEWARGGQSSPRNGAAATGPTASQPAPPVVNQAEEPQDGAGSVPSEEDYLARWEAMLQEAEPAQADELARMWNGQKALRGKIWPDDLPESYTNLKDAVMAKVKDLRQVTS